ncbi:MAG: hypothetical protein ACFCU6_04255 [Balneolaceae bacterium]
MNFQTVNYSKSTLILVAAIFTGMFFTACEDNPASSENFGEHAPAIGFQLLLDDQMLVRYFQREYEFDPGNHFKELVQGDSALVFSEQLFNSLQIGQFRIRWIDQNEVVFDLAEFGEESGGTAGMAGEFNLLFEYLQPNTRQEMPVQDRTLQAIYNKEVETWKFSIDLLQDGRTDLRINLFHIDHSDLVPVPLPIYVNKSD